MGRAAKQCAYQVWKKEKGLSNVLQYAKQAIGPKIRRKPIQRCGEAGRKRKGRP